MSLTRSNFFKWAAAGVVAAGALFAAIVGQRARRRELVGRCRRARRGGRRGRPRRYYAGHRPTRRRPVYYAPPPPVYYRPAPVYYGPPAPVYYGQPPAYYRHHYYNRRPRSRPRPSVTATGVKRGSDS